MHQEVKIKIGKQDRCFVCGRNKQKLGDLIGIKVPYSSLTFIVHRQDCSNALGYGWKFKEPNIATKDQTQEPHLDVVSTLPLTKEAQEVIISDISKENGIKKLIIDSANYESSDKNYKLKEGIFKQRIDDEYQKARIKKIENFTCQIKKCGFYCTYVNKQGINLPIIEIHHIKNKHEGGTENMKNLIVLCPNCHAKADKGVIQFDMENRITKENGIQVEINDNHLFIDSSRYTEAI